MEAQRIKRLPSSGKDARRRYRITHNMRKKGFKVNTRIRTIYAREMPQDNPMNGWIAELGQLGYVVQLTID